MIIFRADANSKLGFGHLSRCLSLAESLNLHNIPCFMVGPHQDIINFNRISLFKKWFIAPSWQTSIDDSNFLIKIALSYNIRWVVLDDYRIDDDYQLALQASGLKWLQFDCSADKPIWANIIVNANPCIRQSDYQPVLRNTNAQFFLGPRFFLLRQEFHKIRVSSGIRKITRILVTFGGGNDYGANLFVISTLLSITSNEHHFIVLSGRFNSSNPDLQQWIKTNGQNRVHLHIDPSNVAFLIASCDLAIMAGGTTTYEAAYCRVPMILISIADNQVSQSSAWSDYGCAIYLGSLAKVSEKSLINAYEKISTPFVYNKMIYSIERYRPELQSINSFVSSFASQLRDSCH